MEKSEWLDRRRRAVTGTDIAAIMGVHPYISVADVWAEKLGLQEGPEENAAMEWGKRLEYVVFEKWVETRPNPNLYRPGELIERILPDVTLAGTPDYVMCVDDLFTSGVEIKTASAYARGWEGDDIPPHYYLQCQWYMILTGLQEWNLAALIGGNRYIERVIPAHKMLQFRMISSAIEFWKHHVVPKIPPHADSLSRYRTIVGELLPKKTKQIEADADIEAIAIALAKTKEEAKNLEKQAEYLQNQLVEHLVRNEADTMVSPDFRFSFKTQSGRKTIDYKAIFKDCNITQDVIDKYTKQGHDFRVCRFQYRGEE